MISTLTHHPMTHESFQSLLIAVVVGLLSGTHTAIWGMYKDALHEGFKGRSFARSMILGAISAAAIQGVLHLSLPSPAALVLLFGLAYAVERGMVEVWKTFVRQEDQSKYFIPMQFSVGGVPVASRLTRLTAGVAYVLAVVACFFLIASLDAAAASLAPTARATLVGLAVGIIVAVGGCWKDAPTEGFDIFKFFRSPIMTVLYAIVLSQLTDNSLQIAVAAVGYERATVETYKKFFFPMKPPGKFAGKPTPHAYMLRRRRYFVPAYVAISTATLLCMTMAVAL